MKIIKLLSLLFVLILCTNCEKEVQLLEDLNPFTGTTWTGSETFNCDKPEGCVEYQILKFNSTNTFTLEYIDGNLGTYDKITAGTYTYTNPDLTLVLPETTIIASYDGNIICLDAGNCDEPSSESLIKQSF